ncbi:MAG: hypothetical protein Ct9H300mP12_02450 [Acidimicrobiales bacterium]|nr:MAG: hypothetical protein Ct9H300mP12_02450 [Acidimicrobiales bacterium]
MLYQKPQSVVTASTLAHTDRGVNFPWSTEPLWSTSRGREPPFSTPDRRGQAWMGARLADQFSIRSSWPATDRSNPRDRRRPLVGRRSAAVRRPHGRERPAGQCS